jgi:hypothetical protein
MFKFKLLWHYLAWSYSKSLKWRICGRSYILLVTIWLASEWVPYNRIYTQAGERSTGLQADRALRLSMIYMNFCVYSSCYTYACTIRFIKQSPSCPQLAANCSFLYSDPVGRVFKTVWYWSLKSSNARTRNWVLSFNLLVKVIRSCATNNQIDQRLIWWIENIPTCEPFT